MRKAEAKARWVGRIRDLLFSLGVLAAASGICLLLSQVNDDNNPFAMAVFILAVVVIASHTDGYWYGIFSAIAGVLCANYAFTKPFFQFEWSIAGYPLTFTAMLLVSLIVSTLTTQIKKQEQLRFDVETEKMRVNLLRSLSHDLRTPLASILGASSVLLEQENLSPEERDELAQDIQKEAHWLSRVTENILSVTKFSGSGVALKKEEEVLDDWENEEVKEEDVLDDWENEDVEDVAVPEPAKEEKKEEEEEEEEDIDMSGGGLFGGDDDDW